MVIVMVMDGNSYNGIALGLGPWDNDMDKKSIAWNGMNNIY